MRRFRGVIGSKRKLLVGAAGVLAAAVPIIFGVAKATAGRAQSEPQNTAPPAATHQYEYEVVSIKLSKLEKGGGMIERFLPTPDGLTETNITVQEMIASAYGVAIYQISGAPGWVESDRYDVEAKMGETMMNKISQIQPSERPYARQKMMRALMEDRFKLTIHRETKNLPVYSLVVAKNGPKLQESKPAGTSANRGKDSDGGREPGMSGTQGGGGTVINSFWNQPIAYLASWLSGSLRSPVIDKTGLTGKYDCTMKWSPRQTRLETSAEGAAPDPNAPTLFDALKDQLGLKLESGKGPVDVIVIDHIERPSGN
jgi:uncharacterized protein (TIGR03435 family)